MLIYIFLIIFLVIFSISYIEKNKKKNLLIFFFIVFWLMATFRSLDIGNDTKNYYLLYKQICKFSEIQNMTWRYEIGYLLVNKIVSFFTSNFTFFLGVINRYVYIIYYKFIKNYSLNCIFSTFLFFTLGIWGKTVNILRLELAIVIVLTGFLLKEKNKKWIGILLSFLGILFQRISIAYLLSFFIPKKISKNFYIISTLLVIILFLNFNIFINLVVQIFPYFKIYLSESSSYGIGDLKIATVISIFKAFFIFLFGIIAYFKSNRALYSKKENQDFLYQINMVYTEFLILFTSLQFNLLDRCSYYFSIFEILMIPNAVKRLNKNEKILCIILILTICVIYFFSITLLKSEWNRLVPYKTIFS